MELPEAASRDRPQPAKSRPWTRRYSVSNVRVSHVAFPPRLMSRFWHDTQAEQGVTHGQGTLSDTNGGKYYATCVVYLIVRLPRKNK